MTATSAAPDADGHRARAAAGERVVGLPRQPRAEAEPLHTAGALEAVLDRPPSRRVSARGAERLPTAREADLQLHELAARRDRQRTHPPTEPRGLPVEQAPPVHA